MITEEQKQDILKDVYERFGEWLTLRTDLNPNGFESIYREIFSPSGLDVETLRSESPIVILETILACCDKLNLSNSQKIDALDTAAYGASKILGL